MTTSPEPKELVERLKSSAEAFRSYPIFTADGDPVLLTVQADELDEAASTLTRLAGELEEAIRDRNAHAEHVRRVSAEAEDGFAALEMIDKCWEACGYPTNRRVVTLEEQILSMVHQINDSEANARAQQAEAALQRVVDSKDDVAEAMLRTALENAAYVDDPQSATWLNLNQCSFLDLAQAALEAAHTVHASPGSEKEGE